MDQIAATAVAIFKARAGGGSELGLETRLADLQIESLDLALILLDLEDAFGIDFPYDPGKPADAFTTVGDVVARLCAQIEARRISRSALAASLARSRSLWVTASGRA
jgi:acyl carrier protein